MAQTCAAARAVRALEPPGRPSCPIQELFELVADPSLHTRIFDAIESCEHELVSDDGQQAVWRITYQTRWSFWKLGGVAESQLVMTIDRCKRKVRPGGGGGVAGDGLGVLLARVGPAGPVLTRQAGSAQPTRASPMQLTSCCDGAPARP
jgi:hypothetical protein